MFNPTRSAWSLATAMLRPRRVDARHARAQPGQRLGQQAAATADVENTQSLERPYLSLCRRKCFKCPVADVGEAHRIEFVERLELARRVPPLVGHGRKLGDLVRVDGRVGHVASALRRAASGDRLPDDQQHRDPDDRIDEDVGTSVQPLATSNPPDENEASATKENRTNSFIAWTRKASSGR